MWLCGVDARASIALDRVQSRQLDDTDAPVGALLPSCRDAASQLHCAVSLSVLCNRAFGLSYPFDVRLPMLFRQGRRDALADLQLLRPLVEQLGARATLQVLSGAGHSFPVRDDMIDALARWMERVTSG